MKQIKKRVGSAYLVVLMVFLAVTLFSGLMISGLNQGVTRTHVHSLQMKAYYLNREVLEATVAVLRADGDQLLKSTNQQREDKITHHNEKTQKDIGESTVTIKREKHPYYKENKDWIVIHVTTKIADERVNQKKDGEPYTFTYEGTAMVLVDNPIIQLYNTPLK